MAVYVKPRRHRTAIIKAEYCMYFFFFFFSISAVVHFVVNGETQWINARQFTDDEVLKWLNLLKSQASNRSGVRLRKLIHTDNPSIQGPWTPYTFR